MQPKRYFLLPALSLLCFNALAINTSTPQNLDFLSSANVSCCVQDTKGAIWFNSNRGLYRYNGQSAEFIHGQLGQTSLICDASGKIFGIGQNKLVVFNSNTLETATIPFDNCFPQCEASMATVETQFFLGIGNKIYKKDGSELILFCCLDKKISITSIGSGNNGNLLIGTEKHGLLTENGEVLLSEAKNISVIFSESPSTIWIGTKGNGIIRYNPYTKGSAQIGNGILFDVRSIVRNGNGELLIGTADGLYKLLESGILSKEKIVNTTSCPINNIFRDRDDNIWIATYYDGLLLSDRRSVNYQRLDSNSDITNIKGLAKGPEGLIYLATDGNGIWSADISKGAYRKLVGTDGYKFQCIYYDSPSNSIWAADFHGMVITINIPDGRARKIHIEDEGRNETILDFQRSGDSIYMAGQYGMYVFRPPYATEGIKKVPGLNKRTFDLELSEDGTIWAASYGVYRIVDGKAVQYMLGGPEWCDNSTISDIEIDEDGRIWLAYFRKGTVCKSEDGIELFNKKSCGLIDDFCFNVIPLGNRTALVATGHEISRISHGGTVMRHPTARSNHLLQLQDGRILAASNDGIKLIETDNIESREKHVLSIDKLSINGKRLRSSILSPEQRGFSFEVTTFDYCEAIARSYFYRMKGYEDIWHEFNIKEPVHFMNMKPGKYTFEVESRSYDGQIIANDAFEFRIKPHWWASRQAIILFTLMALAILSTILYFVYTQKLLTEEISKKEKESKEKTLFFINLSYQLRTPLNLAIGNLERFFNKYGARTAGIENIEDVYNKAKEMRNLISEYVDTRSNQIMDEATMSVAKDAKFLNAAVGAVERNLFSADLNVSLLCTELNMGKTKLTRLIEEASGMTPRSFIEDIKLKHAAQMLLDGTYRVSDISDLLNFSSPMYFSQRFRLKYGCAPKEYCKKEKSA